MQKNSPAWIPSESESILPQLHKPMSPPTLLSDINSKRLKPLRKGLWELSLPHSDLKIPEELYDIQTQGLFLKNWLSS